MKSLIGKCRSAVDRYKMVKDKDKIAVGVSGGKDSLVLLSALSQLKRYYPYNFELIAVTVDPGFSRYSADLTKTTLFCKELDIQHIVKRTELSRVVFDERKEKNPCSLCAKMRRGIIHNIAVENGCNKVALGHNLNDVVETFFMNLLNCGNIGCFSPMSYLSRKDLWTIRPLIFCKENEIKTEAIKNKLPVIASGCPVDGKTQRQKTKELISLLGKEYKDIEKKVLSMLVKFNIDDWGIDIDDW